jgi:DNA-directed RNA polymerase specialized sigma24 family protein
MATKMKAQRVLTLRQAVIFKLFYLEGRSYAEIAELLVISRSTVGSHLSGARLRLRRRIEIHTKAEFIQWAREHLMDLDT